MRETLNNSISTMKLILTLVCFALLLGCKQKEEIREPEGILAETPSPQTRDVVSPDERPLATVNGRPIYKKDLKGRELEYAIIDEILYQEGLRRGVDKQYEKLIDNYVTRVEKGFKKGNDNQGPEMIDKYKKNLVVTAMKFEIQKNLPKTQKPTDKEIEDFYHKYESTYTNLKAIGISASDKKTAEKIHGKATKGQDFEKISSELSDSGVRFISNPVKLTLDKNSHFGELRVGAVSDIIADRGNFIIYRIVEVDKIPVWDVKSAIMHSVVAEKRYQVVRDFAENAKKEHGIRVEILEEDT